MLDEDIVGATESPGLRRPPPATGTWLAISSGAIRERISWQSVSLSGTCESGKSTAHRVTRVLLALGPKGGVIGTASLSADAMACDEFLAAIDAYLDEELSIVDILRMHGHLLSCECCYRVMESEATLHSLLAEDAASDQPPGSLRERIIQRII
jgi:mycothiol system anti-sigma-R factor